jgi:hypothetical protein
MVFKFFLNLNTMPSVNQVLITISQVEMFAHALFQN